MQIKYPKLSISHEAIYQFIYEERPNLTIYLARKHKNRRRKRILRKTQRTLIPNRIPVSERPFVIDARERFGDWESDTIVSGASTAALNVLIERTTRFVKIAKLNRKTAEETSTAIQKILQRYPDKARLSITYDNGTENVWHEKINEKLNTASYFCEPYHSWEKGTVENTIKRIRRYIPKGSSIKKLSNTQIQWVENRINNRPMKVLNYLTPNEVMEQESNSYKFRRYKSLKEAGGALQVRM